MAASNKGTFFLNHCLTPSTNHFSKTKLAIKILEKILFD